MGKREEWPTRKWWPKAGEWQSHSDFGLKILTHLASRIPEAFEIETHETPPVGLDSICCYGWDMMKRRNSDGTVEVSNDHNIFGCRPSEESEPACYYVVRCDDLPGLEVCVCAEHFKQYFPQLDSASGSQ